MKKRIIEEIFETSKVGVFKVILAIALALVILTFLITSLIVYDQYNYMSISFLLIMLLVMGIVIKNNLHDLLTIKVNNEGILINSNVGTSTNSNIKFNNISKIELRERPQKYFVKITQGDQIFSMNIKGISNRDKFVDLLLENTNCAKIKKGLFKDCKI
jgi:hypothetical protein